MNYKVKIELTTNEAGAKGFAETNGLTYIGNVPVTLLEDWICPEYLFEGTEEAIIKALRNAYHSSEVNHRIDGDEITFTIHGDEGDGSEYDIDPDLSPAGYFTI